jgi:uncharacterized alpha-E superfamily protein
MLLSRVADALYWIGRYLERAEHVARIIDVRLDLGLDRRSTSGVWDFRRLYASLSLAAPDELPANPTALVEHAMFDAANRESPALPPLATTPGKSAKKSVPKCGST